MSKREKLIQRFLILPADFTFEEMVILLSYFDYHLKIDAQGSRVKFINHRSNDIVHFHRPHPNNILKRYILKQVMIKLKSEGAI